MTLELLRALRDTHAFDSTPAAGLLGQLHVPFDRLLGRAEYEDTLASAVQRGDRVALTGASGSGKSSITGHVLKQGRVAGIAAIEVRVAVDEPAVVREPVAFARHLVKTVARHLDVAGAPSADRRQARHAAEEATLGRPGRAPVHVGLNGGLPWLNAELATDIGGIARMEPTGQQVIEQAQTVLAIIAAADLQPVLVLDDTDHWLAMPGSPDPADAIAGFFGPVLRTISEDLSAAAAVIAIHDSYFDHPNFQTGRQFIETFGTLPALPDRSALGVILAHRASTALAQSIGPELMLAPDGLDRLWVDYNSVGKNLRQVVTHAHAALVHACDGDADLVSAVHVE